VAIVETESTRKIYEFCKDAQENIDEQWLTPCTDNTASACRQRKWWHWWRIT